MARLTNADAQRFKLNLSKLSWATAGFHRKDACQTHPFLRLHLGTFEFHFPNASKEVWWDALVKFAHNFKDLFFFLISLQQNI